MLNITYYVHMLTVGEAAGVEAVHDTGQQPLRRRLRGRGRERERERERERVRVSDGS